MDDSVPQTVIPVELDLTVGTVLVIPVNDQPYVLFRDAVEALGMSYPRQWRKLKTRSWTCMAQRATQVPGDDQRRTVDVVSVRTFLMWLATVNENRVSRHLRPTLIAFQNETADAIEAYWTRGKAVNPRLRELAEKGHTWEVLASEGVDYSVRDAATILNRDYSIVTGQNMLFQYMRGCGMLDRKNRPYATHKNHLVRRMGVEYTDEMGQTRIGGSQVRVTAEGMAFLHRRLARPVSA